MAGAGGVKQRDECRGQRIIAAGTSSVSAADRSNRFDLHGQQAQASTKDPKHPSAAILYSFFHSWP